MKYRSSSLTGDGITMAVAAGAATLRKTIEDYDAYVMGTARSERTSCFIGGSG